MSLLILPGAALTVWSVVEYVGWAADADHRHKVFLR